MKLGKLQKVLGALVIGGIVGYSSGGISTSAQTLASTEVTTEQVAVVGNEGVLDRHEQEITFMRQYGQEVHASAVKENVKVTVERVIADQYAMKVLISVEKLDGEPFKSVDDLRIRQVDVRFQEELEKEAIYNTIPADAPFVEQLKVMAQFDEGLKAFIKEDDTVDTEGLSAYLRETADTGIASSSASYGMCHTKENTPSKIYFTYEGFWGHPILGEMQVGIESIQGEQAIDKEVDFDVIGYLKEQQDGTLNTKPNAIDEDELAYLEKLKGIDERQYEAEKKYLENQPKNLLEEDILALQIVEGKEDWVIDNIGFVDGQLHIMTVATGSDNYRLELYDQTGEWVSTVYNTGGSIITNDPVTNEEVRKQTVYTVYDIASIEELSQYQFKISGTEKVEEWQGPWEVRLELENNNEETQVITVDEMIPYTVDENAHLYEIQIGKNTINLLMDQVHSKLDNEDIILDINLTDGTERKLDYSSASNRQKDQVALVYSFDGINQEIESIIIGDTLLIMPRQ